MMETKRKMGLSIISADHLSKKYCRELRRSLRYGLADIANGIFRRDSDPHFAQLRDGEFWALQDVSFEVKRGESLAVIGANGAGKSTLLKVLYGLFKPDAGQVRIRGRVGALIELGTGFNPLLSGRENVYVNGAIFGLPRRHVSSIMDQITDFAGLDEMMDTPIQYYSSGMKARLSYAVAAHLNPEILLVDEVLAVGDINYQRKCINHMLKYLDGGGSLIFVSHNPYQIQSVCQRGIVLEGGQLKFAGTAVETLNHYFENQIPARKTVSPIPPSFDSRDECPVVIESLTATPTSGDELWQGEAVRLTLKYTSREDLDVIWSFNIWTGDHWICVTGAANMTPRAIAPGSGELGCLIPRNPLAAGSYLLKASIIEPVSLHPLALYGWQDSPHAFFIRARPSKVNNTQTAMNQLVTLDVEWE